ncbi:MAG: glycoside hydrolase family 18 protein [Acutalibacteraceae bacterium]
MATIQRAVATFLAFISLFFTTITKNDNCKKDENFRVTSYVVARYVQDKDRLYTEDFDIITDVILFGCATFDAKGNVNVDEEVLSVALNNLRNVIGERNVQIHINLLGPGPLESHGDVTKDLNDQGKQHTLAFKSGVLEDNIVNLVNEYDFDGIFFDYEYPLNYINWTPFNQFLVRLDSKLGDKILGLAVTEWDLKLSLGSFMAVDRFEVMLYDIYDEQGRHSTPAKAEELSKKLKLSGVPEEKFDFGLPFYARPTDHDTYWYSYEGYYDKLDENGYYYDSQLDKTFWFNRPADIAEKTQYALDKGFGGVMYWHYTCDIPSSNPLSLLRAVGETVDNYTPAETSKLPC